MSLKTLKKINRLSDKKVLVRVDFNVPMKGGKIIDDTRIRAAKNTIDFLLDKGAVVIIMSHFGRPEGVDPEYSLAPVARAAEKVFGKKINFVKVGKNEEGYFEFAKKQLQKSVAGDVVMLENVRFFKGESKDKGDLSKKLSELADAFVLDGFAVAHRGDASVSGVAKYLPACAGILLEKEIIGLSKAVKNPKKPYVVVLGGAKSETKIPVMKNLLPKCDAMLIGGGLVNTYLYALGYEVGDSLVDRDLTKEVLKYAKSKKVIKPTDLIVGDREGKKYRHVFIGKKPVKICGKGEGIFDIGPETIKRYAVEIKKAKTLVWNGAVGYFEVKPYDVGTMSIARLVASRSRGKCFGIIGGGETLLAMEKIKMMEFVDLVSTGGGAMLEFLAGDKLPGVLAVGG
ncbi:MAG TPA: phosphoglycerate kinase [Candidatus Magasanikbacteria bacterium]|nr:phosphoglycerate kinase [Candidatus Magasanikbacteria bacterium]